MNNQIVIKRKKRTNQSEVFMNNFVQWVEYWRKNPHRFITDYLGLKLYDFQKILIYQMNFYNNFIFIASRGLANKMFKYMKGILCILLIKISLKT